LLPALFETGLRIVVVQLPGGKTQLLVGMV